jgi:ribosomal protein S18 acetylase RimI-like enzyme
LFNFQKRVHFAGNFRVASLTVPQNPLSTGDGMRPLNLRTDLADLADLMELVFSDSMDANGQSAIREMRYLSRVGLGLNFLASVNELAIGVRHGYVWIEDGKLVGNVSLYPAHWPSDLGRAWIVANVGVHPTYQRRGIARRLMQASMEFIRAQGGTCGVLQVDYDNTPARNLYTSLGFRDERAWTTWRRSTVARVPESLSAEPIFITRRRGRDWSLEYALAKRLRPAEQGGLGWQRPLHPSLFRRSLWQQITDFLSLQSLERLSIYSEDRQRILASLWIESGFAAGSAQLTLLVEPPYQGLYDDALIGTAVRRFNALPIVIEHPMDETDTANVLEYYRFNRRRTVMHMRWDVR